MIAAWAARRAAAMKGRSMRWMICALFMLVLAPRASAADLDVLRGSEPVGPATYTRWSGFYFGGDVGYSNINADFGKSTAPLVAFSLRELALEADALVSTWPVLGKASNSGVSFGGFAGYNSQWENVVLGIEGNYTHSPVTAVAHDSPISRVVNAGGNTYAVNLSGSGSLEVTDYASLRARGGYILGDFLPYGFIGAVIATGTYAVTTNVNGQQNSPAAAPPVVPCNPAVTATCVNYNFSNSAGQNGALFYGFTIGGGLDVAVTANLFVRAEFEYIRFAPVASIQASIATARLGAGLKF
jgi:outer membrane immunogenic protein